MNMHSPFQVPLEPSPEDKEVYRADDANLILVEVHLGSEKLPATRDCRVTLTLTKDGMVGLGSSLIRAAIKSEKGIGCWEFENARLGAAVEQLGVYLHPASCKLVVNLSPLGKVSELLGNDKSHGLTGGNQ
jgi:hypothetical protein